VGFFSFANSDVLAGTTPLNGSTNATFGAFTQNATGTVNRVSEYLVEVSSMANGSVNFTNGWYEEGSNLEIVANPDAYFKFGSYTGTTNGTNNTLTLENLANPQEITANFTPELNSSGTPYPWAAMYYGSLSKSQLDSLLTKDTDGDGMVGNDEYTADTDPTNPFSVFYSSINKTGINLHNTSTGRVYGVSHRPSLTAGDWNRYIEGFTGTGSNLVVNFYSGEPEGFYTGEVNK